jgi:hypothetical protein
MQASLGERQRRLNNGRSISMLWTGRALRQRNGVCVVDGDEWQESATETEIRNVHARSGGI